VDFVVDDDLKSEAEKIIEGVVNVKNKEISDEGEDSNFEKLEQIFDKLKIESKEDRMSFLNKLIYDRDAQDILKTKFLYFKLKADLEKMETLRNRIDNRAYKRTKMLLFVLWVILIVQTVIFYHMIYNVEHLGWDLVEPSTYLFQSIVLLLGVMAYTKFHRNYMSGSKLLEDAMKKLSLRSYAKNNFNQKIYNDLKKESILIKKYLNN
jgi:Mitochondrial calcium uniporter